MQVVNTNTKIYTINQGESMQIIDNILKIMQAKEITAYKMEKEAGIKQASFTNWKKGTQPTADKLIKIIEYLGVSPNELFGYEATYNLSENDKEMLELFQQLPEREQYKYIARLEDAVEKLKE